MGERRGVEGEGRRYDWKVVDFKGRLLGKSREWDVRVRGESEWKLKVKGVSSGVALKQWSEEGRGKGKGKRKEKRKEGEDERGQRQRNLSPDNRKVVVRVRGEKNNRGLKSSRRVASQGDPLCEVRWD